MSRLSKGIFVFATMVVSCLPFCATHADEQYSLPMRSRSWKLPTVIDPNEQMILQRQAQLFQQQNIAVIPQLRHVGAGNLLLMRTPHLLLIVDLKKEGKRIWQYPWEESIDVSIPAPTATERRSGVTPRSEFLKQRVWQDAIYGSIGSDGKQIYLIGGLSIASYGRRRVVFPGSFRRAQKDSPKSYNQLVALSLKKEGAMQWEIGGEDGNDEEKLAGAFFLGIPLHVDEKLYALIERNAKIELVELQAKTGKLNWSLELLDVKERSILNDPMRRLLGTEIALDDGLLVCSTSAGQVVAVDLEKNKVRWRYKYENHGDNVVQHRLSIHTQLVPGKNWIDSKPVIAEGNLLLTPGDCDTLHCLDIKTGKVKWERARKDLLYIAGVWENAVLLIGGNRVISLQLTDGKPAWKHEKISLGKGVLATGRGAMSGRHYFLPTSASEVVKIDAAAGKIVARASLGIVPGNLLFHREEMISLSPNGVYSYYQSDAIRKNVAEQLKKDPKNPWALGRKAELLIHDGRHKEAVAILRKLNRDHPEDDSARVMFVRQALLVLREDYAANRELADDVEKRIDMPKHQFELARLKAEYLEKSGKLVEALEAYIILVEKPKEKRSKMIVVEKDLRVSYDIWLKSAFRRLQTAATPQQREKMEKLIEQRFFPAKKPDKKK